MIESDERCLRRSSAFEYYLRTVYPGVEESVIGMKCTELEYDENGCSGAERVSIGFAVPHNAKGEYIYGENCTFLLQTQTPKCNGKTSFNEIFELNR